LPQPHPSISPPHHPLLHRLIFDLTNVSIFVVILINTDVFFIVLLQERPVMEKEDIKQALLQIFELQLE
jgi:hypothetical protein